MTFSMVALIHQLVRDLSFETTSARIFSPSQTCLNRIQSPLQSKNSATLIDYAISIHPQSIQEPARRHACNAETPSLLQIQTSIPLPNPHIHLLITHLLLLFPSFLLFPPSPSLQLRRPSFRYLPTPQHRTPNPPNHQNNSHNDPRQLQYRYLIPLPRHPRQSLPRILNTRPHIRKNLLIPLNHTCIRSITIDIHCYAAQSADFGREFGETGVVLSVYYFKLV